MSGLNSSKNQEANLKRRMNDDEQNGSCKKLKLIDVSEYVLSIYLILIYLIDFNIFN